MEVVRRIHRRATEGQRLAEPVGILEVRSGGVSPAPEAPPSALPGFDAEAHLAVWVELWRSYDLDRVRQLFLPDARVTYLSSEREGLIAGLDEIIDHHAGFGFVAGGLEPDQELWVEEGEGRSFGNTVVVTGVWYFGDRAQRDAAQRGRAGLSALRASARSGTAGLSVNSSAGNTTRVHTSTAIIPIVSSRPIVARPKWLDRGRLPKLKTVVRVANRTARAVLVASSLSPAAAGSRARCTMWIPLSTPTPSSKGRVITLAKLKGMSSRTDIAPV